MARKESYEEMLNNLQDILSKMESNELPLEELMKEYENGVKLINKLYQIILPVVKSFYYIFLKKTFGLVLI